MKCPVCEGSKAYVGEGLWAAEMCPHCHGTGEIQEGDWWMCKFNTTQIPLFYIGYSSSGGSGWSWTEDGFLDEIDRLWADFKILYRMEKVK